MTHPNTLAKQQQSIQKVLVVLSLAFCICLVWLLFSKEAIPVGAKFALFSGSSIVLPLLYYHWLFQNTLSFLQSEHRDKKHLLALTARLIEKELHLDIAIDELTNREASLIKLVLVKLTEGKREQLVRRLTEKISECESVLKQIEKEIKLNSEYESMWLTFNDELNHLRMVRSCFE